MRYLAIPVVRINCPVAIDRGQTWSVIHEAVMWGLFKTPRTIGELTKAANLSRPVMLAVLTRLMQFRLIEISIEQDAAIFRLSKFGEDALKSPHGLPTFPQRSWRRISFVVELLSGTFFRSRDVTLITERHIESLRKKPGTTVQAARVRESVPIFDSRSNIRRLTQLAELDSDQQIAAINGRSTLIHERYMLVRWRAQKWVQCPPSVSQVFLDRLAELAASSKEKNTIEMSYQPPEVARISSATPIACDFNPEDIVIGGSAQRKLLGDLLDAAKSQVIIQSTFLKTDCITQLLEMFRKACRRGVKVSLLWGANKAGELERQHATLREIESLVRNDPVLYQNVHLHPFSVNSHAKLIITDTMEGDWVAVVSSCNWLGSPMRATEMSVILRDQQCAANIIDIVAQFLEREGELEPLAFDLALIAEGLRMKPSTAETNARLTIVVSDMHDEIVRQASGEATRRFVMSSHRLGATARPGAIIPSETAAEKEGVNPILIYTQKSGPLKKNRQIREIISEADAAGVGVLYSKKIPLHAKFLIWGSDDALITSLNWGSSASGGSEPPAEVGVHINMNGIGNDLVSRLRQFVPELDKHLSGR